MSDWHGDTFPTYATYNWPLHSQDLADNSTLSSHIVSFFKSSSFSTWSQVWVQIEDSARWDLWNRENCIRDLGDTPEAPAPPLYFAAMFGCHQVVKALLDDGSNPGGVYIYPLFAAVMNENVKAVQALLVGGADTSVKRISDEGIFGETPLHMAARLWGQELVEILMDGNADANAQSAHGWIPLCEALSEDSQEKAEPSPELVRLLLPDPSGFQMEPWDSPLHVAAKYGQLTAARIIIREQRTVYVNKRNKMNDTPLHEAVLQGNQHMVRLLLDAGANKSIRGRYGWTPLQVAAWEQNIAMIELLGDFSVDKVVKADGLVKPTPPIPDPKPLTIHSEDERPPGWRQEPSSKQYFALRHFLSTNPNDHVWRILLADCYFRHGNHEVALPLHEQGLCLNPGNRDLESSNDVAHSLPCRRCEKEIRGDLYKCVQNTCYANLCKSCALKWKGSGCRIGSAVSSPVHTLRYQWDSKCWLPSTHTFTGRYSHSFYLINIHRSSYRTLQLSSGAES
jgi:ankyrin repeat protein